MMPAARLTPGLTARFGARTVCVAGLILVAAGLAVISQVGTDTSYWLFLAGLIPLGIGMGTAMTPATAAITVAILLPGGSGRHTARSGQPEPAPATR